MEKFPNINNKEEVQTESMQAGFLENGDSILLGEVEFEVVDVDHQYKNGRIKIKNSIGEVSEISSFNQVEKVIKEPLEKVS